MLVKGFGAAAMVLALVVMVRVVVGGEGAAGLVGRMPREVDGAVGVVGLGAAVGELAEGKGGVVGPAVMGLMSGVRPATLGAWLAFAQEMGWTAEEAAERLIGRRAAVVWRGVREGRRAGWAVVTEISEETDRALRAKLRVSPRTIVRGRPVLAVEGGELLLASGVVREGEGGEGVTWACLTPAGDEGMLEEMVGLLSERGAVEGGNELGATAAAGELRGLGESAVAALIRLPGEKDDGGWDRYAAMGAWREVGAEGHGGKMRALIVNAEGLSDVGRVAERGDVVELAERGGGRAGLVAVASESEVRVERVWSVLRPLGLAMGVLAEASGERVGEEVVAGLGGVEGIAGMERCLVVEAEGRWPRIGMGQRVEGGTAESDRMANWMLASLGRSSGGEMHEGLFGLDGLLPEAERRERWRPVFVPTGGAGWSAVWRSEREEAALGGAKKERGGGSWMWMGMSGVSEDAARGGGAAARELVRGMAGVGGAGGGQGAERGVGMRRWVSRGAVWPGRAVGLGVWVGPTRLALEVMKDVERVEWGVWVEGEGGGRVRVEVGVVR